MKYAKRYAEIYIERNGDHWFEDELPAVGWFDDSTQVARHRGQPAADRLRTDALLALKQSDS